MSKTLQQFQLIRNKFDLIQSQTYLLLLTRQSGSSYISRLLFETNTNNYARLWNSLPHDIVASDTLSHFRCGVKTFLFRQSYPSILF